MGGVLVSNLARSTGISLSPWRERWSGAQSLLDSVEWNIFFLHLGIEILSSSPWPAAIQIGQYPISITKISQPSTTNEGYRNKFNIFVICFISNE